MASDEQFAAIAHDLERIGYSLSDGLLDPQLVDALAMVAYQHNTDGQLIPAGTGKERSHDDSVRGDSIAWLEPDSGQPAVTECLKRFDQLRRALNQHLFLNLHDVESHFAFYPPGTGYEKHLDQFATGDRRRQVSLVLYLNSRWRDTDGGELRLHLDDDSHLDVRPVAGRLVLFESSRFWHEVRPATRDRLSIAGWFRTRS
mgnify:CR=1 FL=1